MKNIYRICGKISLVCYVFLLYQTWHLCRYGGIRRHFLLMFPAALVFPACIVLWLIARRRVRKESPDAGRRKGILWAEVIFAAAAAALFGGGIIYSAIPYNGALSWKVDEWMRRKTVTLEHNNVFQDGVEGILADLDSALDLPEELYISNEYQMSFDETGTVTSIYAFLYGRDDNGETRTYLVDYSGSGNMTVWTDGRADASYEDGMRLDPMLRILQKAPWEEQVKAWTSERGGENYEILYLGRRSFSSSEGLEYLPGDADGDGQESGTGETPPMWDGGEVTGYEVSLHIPEAGEVTPVRYMMEPEYTGQEELNAQQAQEQAENAIASDSWITDNTDGSMYFFLNDTVGWRLVVTDAALGSRTYALEGSKDGGASWTTVNADPFGGQLGVTEGLIFYDEEFGVAGLTGASQSYSRLYVTTDGGVTYTQMQMPGLSEEELPKIAEEYGYGTEDYDYLYMPEKAGDVLTVLAVPDAGGKDGVLFRSSDFGKTWNYVGATTG